VVLKSKRGRGRSRGGRAAIGSEKGDVHPEPSTRFHFALHLDDEALAFLGGNDDTLHVRPSLWWLALDVASLPCHKGRPLVQLSCGAI
jgi:hypothetical protein